MILLIDIDHTLSDAFWRDEMIAKGDSWDSYHEASFMDAPIPETVAMARALRWSGYDLIAITSRPEKWRTLTNQWFAKYSIPVDDILMRPNDNYQPAPELKLSLAKPYLEKSKSVILIEDRDDVCQAFREAGVFVLQCHARKSFRPPMPCEEVMNKELEKLLEDNKKYVENLTPKQKSEMLRKQAEGFAKSEAQWAEDFRKGRIERD